jgi:hypothetical protein
LELQHLDTLVSSPSRESPQHLLDMSQLGMSKMFRHRRAERLEGRDCHPGNEAGTSWVMLVQASIRE